MESSATDISWYIDRRLVHEFHTSERKRFRECRRAWDWNFRQNLYPQITEKPLDFGTAYHVGLETFYNPKTWHLPIAMRVELAIAAFVKKTNQQRARVVETGMLLDDDVEKDFDERVELGIGMLRHLGSTISPKEDNFTPVAVEQQFMVPIPHPDTSEALWCACDICWERWVKFQRWEKLDNEGKYARAAWKGLPVVYAGKIDCIVVDEHGDYYIIDWKTARSIPQKHDFLILDDQVGSYPWALWSLGMQIRGFIYHEQKKGFPIPPTKNKNVRLGRMYSVSASQDTDYDTYFETVTKHDAAAYEAGLYDYFLNFLETEGMIFYYRETVHKTEEEFLNIQKFLGMEVLDMLQKDLRIYPSPSRFACSRCPFEIPCVEKNQGGDYQYALDTMFRKKPPYYLRDLEKSTEKAQL
jgi:hypothetical protein